MAQALFTPNAHTKRRTGTLPQVDIFFRNTTPIDTHLAELQSRLQEAILYVGEWNPIFEANALYGLPSIALSTILRAIKGDPKPGQARGMQPKVYNHLNAGNKFKSVRSGGSASRGAAILIACYAVVHKTATLDEAWRIARSDLCTKQRFVVLFPAQIQFQQLPPLPPAPHQPIQLLCSAAEALLQ